MTLNFWKKEPVEDIRIVKTSFDSEHISKSSLVFVPEELSSESVDNIYTRLTYWVISVGVFIFPLFFFVFRVGTLDISKYVLLVLVSGGGLILYLVGIVSTGYFKWRNMELTISVGAVAVATVLATIFSISRIKSLYGYAGNLSNSLIVVLLLSILYLLIINIYDDKGKKLQLFFALSLIFVFLYGVLQLFGVHLISFDFAKTRIFNTIGSSNALGVLAAVSLPFFHRLNAPLLYLKNYWSKFGVALAFIILVLLNWWILWTVAIIGMFSLVALESLNSRNFKISKSIFPLVVIVIGVFLMVVNLEIPFVKNKLPAEISPSMQLSTRIANSVLKEKFILGYGPENFSIAFDRFGSRALSNTTLSSVRFYDSGSQFFNSLIHGGVVLAAALLFLIGYLVWKIFRVTRQINNSSADNGVLAMMLALVAGIFLYPFNLSLMFVFYVTLGLTGLILWENKKSYYSIEKSPFLSLVSSLGFICGLIFVLVVSYFGLMLYFADFKYNQALNEPDIQKKANILTEAIKWNENNDLYFRTLSMVAIDLLSDEIKKSKKDPQGGAKIQNYISSAINFSKRATEIQPHEASNWANLGLVYSKLLTLVDNVDALSVEAYTKAAELRPGDPSYYFQIGTIYMTEGNLLLQFAASNPKSAVKARESAAAYYVKSEKAFKKAIEISSNHGMAIYNLGSVYDRQGKTNDAIRQLEKLAPFNSNQPGLMFELGLLYYRAGRKDDAVSQLQRAILLTPDYANARWYLGLIYEERNDIPAAVEQMEKILSVNINKGNKTITDKLKQLRSGVKTSPPTKAIDQEPL